VAVNANELGIATELPVAEGDCEAHVGATFLVTVHVLVLVLVPLLSEATKVLAPVLSCDESTSTKFTPVPKVVPFNDQVTAHVLSDGDTPKAVEVEARDETRTDAVEGEADAMAQAF
jgi:hypothetical protein